MMRIDTHNPCTLSGEARLRFKLEFMKPAGGFSTCRYKLFSKDKIQMVGGINIAQGCGHIAIGNIKKILAHGNDLIGGILLEFCAVCQDINLIALFQHGQDLLGKLLGVAGDTGLQGKQ